MSILPFSFTSVSFASKRILPIVPSSRSRFISSAFSHTYPFLPSAYAIDAISFPSKEIITGTAPFTFILLTSSNEKPSKISSSTRLLTPDCGVKSIFFIMLLSCRRLKMLNSSPSLSSKPFHAQSSALKSIGTSRKIVASSLERNAISLPSFIF